MRQCINSKVVYTVMNNYMLLSMIIYVRYDLRFNRRRLQQDNSVVEFVLHIDRSTILVITKRQNDIYLLAYEDCPFPAPSLLPLLFV